MALTIEGSSDMNLLKSRMQLLSAPVLVDDPGSGDRLEADVPASDAVSMQSSGAGSSSVAVAADGTAAPGGPDESG